MGVNRPTSLLEASVILPAQHSGPHRNLTPEHRLMIAVLQDAINCVEKHRCAKDFRGRRLFDEAQQWLLSGKAEWPYSFEHICAVFGLDSDAVRESLRLVPRPLTRDRDVSLGS
jgi:hypothetical protein